MTAATIDFLRATHMPSQSGHVATTLYAVIEAVSEQVLSDEEYLITPAVLKLLNDCKADFLSNGSVAPYKKLLGGSRHAAIAV